MIERQYLLPDGSVTGSFYEWYDTWRDESPRFFKCELCGEILIEMPESLRENKIAPFCKIDGHRMDDYSLDDDEEEWESFFNCPRHGYLGKAIHHPMGTGRPAAWGWSKWYYKIENGKYTLSLSYHFEEVYVYCTEGCSYESHRLAAPDFICLQVTMPCGHKAGRYTRNMHVSKERPLRCLNEEFPSES